MYTPGISKFDCQARIFLLLSPSAICKLIPGWPGLNGRVTDPALTTSPLWHLILTFSASLEPGCCSAANTNRKSNGYYIRDKQRSNRRKRNLIIFLFNLDNMFIYWYWMSNVDTYYYYFLSICLFDCLVSSLWWCEGGEETERDGGRESFGTNLWWNPTPGTFLQF